MSLVVKKKGGKSFAPKIPHRRPGAPSSAHSSARPSVERQSQTPAPHPQLVQTIIIPDGEGTPDRAHSPLRTIDLSPTHPLLENSKVAPSHTRAQAEASAHSSPKRAAIPPERKDLKRKARDQNIVVGIPSKRRQPVSMDAPKSPSHPLPIEEPQAVAIRAQPQMPMTSLLFSEVTNYETQPVNTPQPPQATPHANEAKATGTSTTMEFPESTAHVQESIASCSIRPALSESIQHDECQPQVFLNDQGPTREVGFGAEGTQLAQNPAIVPMIPLSPDGTPGEPVPLLATSTKRKVLRRRKVQQGGDGSNIRTSVEMHLDRTRRVPGEKSTRENQEDGKKKNKRAETPDGAENEEINAVEIKMVELCKDLRIGKKFSIHDELRQREKEKTIKAQFAKAHPELIIIVEGTLGGEEEAVEEDAQGGGGPQMQIVDGQIVMNQNSMQLDRQKRAWENRGNVEEVTENDFSKITTSGTHMKRERAQFWDMAANEIFWKGLRMFGTDFEMIAKMFPYRNRRQIKLKFNKEERDHPAKIDRILKGASSSIELDTYEELSGVKLEDVEAIDAEREKLEAQHIAEEESRLEAHAVTEKKKKEAIGAARHMHGTADDDGASGEKGNQARPDSSDAIQPECENTYVASKNASKTKRDGAARKPKKRPAADANVQVLVDA